MSPPSEPSPIVARRGDRREAPRRAQEHAHHLAIVGVLAAAMTVADQRAGRLSATHIEEKTALMRLDSAVDRFRDADAALKHAAEVGS